MTSIYSLLKKIDTLLVQVEQEKRRLDTRSQVVIYNLTTGEPLPGYEPRLDGATVWLPDNGRGTAA